MSRVRASAVVVFLLIAASPLQAACPFGLGAATDFSAGDNPVNLTTADFNEDGFADFAVRLEESDTVAVLLADGNGGLGAPVEFHLGVEIVGDIAAGDVNGDGHADIVAASGAVDWDYAGAVNILLGNGNGGFTLGTPYELHQNPYYLVVGDFNADGKADVAVAKMTSFVLLLGTANGLVQKSDISVQGSSQYLPMEIVHGDFDGDGKLDVAVPDFTRNIIHTFFGAGDGTFAIGPTLASDPAFWADALAAGDFDGDGDDDLAHAEHGSSSQEPRLNTYVSNGGSRTFASRVEHEPVVSYADEARAADMDGDGDLDVVVSGWLGMTVLFNDGSGTFATSTPVGNYARGLEVADVNGDGSADVATAANVTDGWLDLYLNECAHARLTLTSSANPSTVHASVTFTVTLIPPDSGVAATGTLTLKRGGATIATHDVSTGSSFTHSLDDLPDGVTTMSAHYSGDGGYAATSASLMQTVELPPFGAPTRTMATFNGSQVEVSWTGTQEVDYYQVWRRSGPGTWSMVGTSSQPTFTDLSAPASTAHLYKVRAVSTSEVTSAFGTPDLAHTFTFTSPAITSGVTVIRLADLIEVRTLIASARSAAGLPEVVWAEASPSLVKAGHWTEVRTALAQVRSSIGMSAVTFTSTPALGGAIVGSHVTEVRAALQ